MQEDLFFFLALFIVFELFFCCCCYCLWKLSIYIFSLTRTHLHTDDALFVWHEFWQVRCLSALYQWVEFLLSIVCESFWYRNEWKIHNKRCNNDAAAAAAAMQAFSSILLEKCFILRFKKYWYSLPFVFTTECLNPWKYNTASKFHSHTTCTMQKLKGDYSCV